VHVRPRPGHEHGPGTTPSIYVRTSSQRVHSLRATSCRRPVRSFPSPAPPGWNRQRFGFPLSFAPHRHQQRTSGAGTGHRARTRNNALRHQPNLRSCVFTQCVRPRVARRQAGLSTRDGRPALHSCWRGSPAKCPYSPRRCESFANTLCATRAGAWAPMIASTRVLRLASGGGSPAETPTAPAPDVLSRHARRAWSIGQTDSRDQSGTRLREACCSRSLPDGTLLRIDPDFLAGSARTIPHPRTMV
jgi:hypothetical protein